MAEPNVPAPAAPTPPDESRTGGSEFAAVFGVWRRIDWALSGVVAVMAFTLLGMASGRIVYPDASSQVAAEQLGLVPNVSPLSPIWCWLLRTVAGLGPAASAVFRLHLLGRLCATVTAVLVYRIAFGVLRGLLFPAGITRGYALAMGAVLRCSSFGSSLLLLCLPVCHAASAPHAAIFAAMLACCVGATALWFVERRTLPALLLYAFAAAVGCVESPAVALTMPWWMTVVYLAPDVESPDGGIVGCTVGKRVILSGWSSILWGAVAVLVAAAGVYLVAQSFAATAGAQLAHIDTPLKAVPFFVRRYLSELRQVYPAGGTLLILLGVLAPAGLAVTLSPGFFADRRSVWHVLFYLAIGVVSASQILPMSRLCLWMYIPSSVMRTGACVLGALSFPFAAGFFLVTTVRELFPALIALRPGPDAAEKAALLGVEKPLQQFLRGLSFSAAAVVLLGLPVAGAVYQHRYSDGPTLAVIADYLDELVADIAGRPLTVTDRAFDSALLVEGYALGSEVAPLPFALPQDSAERRIAASYLPDAVDRDDYAIGTGTMLREWTRHAPEKVARVTVLAAPNVWSRTGYKLVPHGLVLRPMPDATPVDLDALLAEQRAVWGRWTNRVDDLRPGNRILRPLLRAITRQLSLTANEFGYLCESENSPETAEEAYLAARALDSLNLTARYNLLDLLGPNTPDGIREEVDELRAAFDRVPISVLMNLQGRIHSDVLRQNIALNEITRTQMRTSTGTFLSLLQESSHDSRMGGLRASAAMASTFLARREWDKARAEYETILAEAPDFIPALYGMATLSAQVAKDADAADPWLERLRQAGIGEEPALVFKGILLKELGDARALQALLEPLVNAQQENQDIWLLWGWAAVQLGNDAAKRTAYWHLTDRANARRLELYAALRDGDLHVISAKQRALLEDTPNDTTLRKAAMGAAWADQDLTTARRLARSVLQEDDRDGPAHFVLGMDFALKGKPGMALTHLLRAEEYGLSTVPLYNNIGMVYLEAGDPEHALVYARHAHELAPNWPEVSDTLVAAEIALKHFDDAKKHLEEALELHPDNRSLRLRARKIPGFVIRPALATPPPAGGAKNDL